jgi:hypothetical protein
VSAAAVHPAAAPTGPLEPPNSVATSRIAEGGNGYAPPALSCTVNGLNDAPVTSTPCAVSLSSAFWT